TRLNVAQKRRLHPFEQLSALGRRELGLGVEAEPRVIGGRHRPVLDRLDRVTHGPGLEVPLREVELVPAALDVVGHPPRQRRDAFEAVHMGLVAVARVARRHRQLAGAGAVPRGLVPVGRVGDAIGHELHEREDADPPQHDLRQPAPHVATLLRPSRQGLQFQLPLSGVSWEEAKSPVVPVGTGGVSWSKLVCSTLIDTRVVMTLPLMNGVSSLVRDVAGYWAHTTSSIPSAYDALPVLGSTARTLTRALAALRPMRSLARHMSLVASVDVVGD